MRVCVFGLWHLGCVTAACLAKAGHQVVALDPDHELIIRLRKGEPPLLEPSLEDLIEEEQAAGRLRFESDPRAAALAELVWVTFDTPVDEDDLPQPDVVVERVAALVDQLDHDCLVLISSQLPVGTTRRLANRAGTRRGRMAFAYSPENLRLGRAIEVFTKPDRVVIGLDESSTDRATISALLAPFTENIVWMGIEAAEMTKHAINAFLATSVAFMNEVATVCEQVGADAKDVERGLKSESRIGPGAYLSPGGAFAGGTLARDVATLAGLSPGLTLIPAVRDSNRRHRLWEVRRLRERYAELSGKRFALLGLTYKAGTSTLRRSGAVELAAALNNEGAAVVAFDPAISELPDEIATYIDLVRSPEAAARGADALILATAWPEFRDLAWERLLGGMRDPTVIDANWFLAPLLKERSGIAYVAVGLPWRLNTKVNP